LTTAVAIDVVECEPPVMTGGFAGAALQPRRYQVGKFAVNAPQRARFLRRALSNFSI
jgi:hypothetical protein